MDKKILITSVNKYHKKNFKYLDYGSLNIRNDSSPDDILFNHPGNNFNEYLKDIKKIKKIYIVILKQVSAKLNQHFKIKKNLRYWKILIGPWLMSFISAYYEKNLLINTLLKHKGKLIIPVVNLRENKNISKNYNDFFYKNLLSSDWQDYLFSLILGKKKLKNNVTLIKKKIIIKKIFTNKKINFTSILKKKFILLFNKLFSSYIRNQKVIFFDNTFSLKNKINLLFKNFCFPIPTDLSYKNEEPDFLLRNLLGKSNIKNTFYKEILKESFLNLPTCFLEDFHTIKNIIFKKKRKAIPKLIVSTYGMSPNTFETFCIAENISYGSKLILNQHGPRYSNIKNNFMFNHELSISDKYLVPNKIRKSKKIINLGTLKTIKNIYNKSGDKILFLMLTKSRYNRLIDTEFNNIKQLYKYYKFICPDFYSILNKKLKAKLIFRSGKKNYWNEKEILKKNCRLAKIDFNREESNYFEIATRSKIVICSYLSTAFYETLYINKPVILYHHFLT